MRGRDRGLAAGRAAGRQTAIRFRHATFFAPRALPARMTRADRLHAEERY